MKQYLEKLLIKEEFGKIRLIELSSIFYIEAEGGDTVIKTKRKRLYRSKEPLGEIEKRLKFPFFRCHKSFIVNLNRIRTIEKRGADYQFRLDPPVNTLIPISRKYFKKLIKLLKI
jgi:DNA-binding LytR/AlgR family response regulator